MSSSSSSSKPRNSMSGSQPGTPSTPHSPPPNSSASSSSSKLPKFLQPKAMIVNRDRSKSLNESMAYASAPEYSSPKPPRKSINKLIPGRDKQQQSPAPRTPTSVEIERGLTTPSEEDAPIIIEPPSSSSTTPHQPRSRLISERPLSPSALYSSHSASATTSSSTTSHSSSSRMSDLPTRLSGWFTHTFSTSSTDLSLPSLLTHSHISNPPPGSPSASSGSPSKATSKSALLAAAKHGKGHLDKAMRYLMDSDSTPDRCPDPIWLLGVQHPGYEPPPPPSALASSTSSIAGGQGRRSLDAIRKKGSPNNSVIRGGGGGPSQTDLSASQPAGSPAGAKKANDPGANWPPVFYADFTSRIWVTYRNQFAPIRDQRLGDLAMPCALPVSTASSSLASSATYTPQQFQQQQQGQHQQQGGPGRRKHYHNTSDSDTSHASSVSWASQGSSQVSSSPPTSKRWNWPASLGGGEKGWTSDAGWGCMLRTGQSLLANALVCLHLGRDFRMPNPGSPAIAHLTAQMTASITPAQYATYIQILTWFMDTPSPYAPFSVHRMALAGKELGKDVGMWFGPSTAAGAIRKLVGAFGEAGMGVVVAGDGVVVECEVYAASRASSSEGLGALGRRGRKGQGQGQGAGKWGDKGVLVLIPTRLGIDGVNPVYYETIKVLYTWPQSVGIAGGRPSSSYYFVGSQADNLFYLDPHHARPAVPLRPWPPHTHLQQQQANLSHSSSSRYSGSPSGYTSAYAGGGGYGHTPGKKSYDSGTGDSGMSQYSSDWSGGGGAERRRRGGAGGHVRTPTSPKGSVRTGSAAGSEERERDMDVRDLIRSTTSSHKSDSQSSASALMGTEGEEGELDAYREHLIASYSPGELRTFHCERVRKMPLSGLDPSMLIGFLCKDEADWRDLRSRIGELPKKYKAIFSVQDEPLTWPSDSDDNMGLESISEPDDDGLIALDDDDEDDGDLLDQDRDQDDDGDVEGEEEYFDTRSASASISSAGKPRSRSGEDTEEDPVGPITPGPGSSRFDLPGRVERSVSEKTDGSAGEIEDDWVDTTESPAGPGPGAAVLTPRGERVPVIPHQREKSAGGASTGSTGPAGKKKKKQRQAPVPVPFPVSVEDDDYSDLGAGSVGVGGEFPVVNEDAIDAQGGMGQAHSTGSRIMRQTATTVTARSGAVPVAAAGQHGGERRARDGGRTQSGGVKAVFDDG